MVQCQCRVLNHMTGVMAADYVRTHLDAIGGGGDGAIRTWKCRETGMRWVDERWDHDGSPQLRRRAVR